MALIRIIGKLVWQEIPGRRQLVIGNMGTGGFVGEVALIHSVVVGGESLRMVKLLDPLVEV